MTDDSPPERMEPAPSRPSSRIPDDGAPSTADTLPETDSAHPDSTDLRERLAAAHRDFLTTHAELQREFLRTRRAAADTFADGRTTHPTSDSAAGTESSGHWSPADLQPVDPDQLDAPSADCRVDTFGHERLEAFVVGDHHACFGPGFDRASCHTEPPQIPVDETPFDRIDLFEPRGGPRGAGYVRAVCNPKPGSDQASPPLSIREITALLAAFYLTGCGDTLLRDGWQFQLAEGPPNEFGLHPHGRTTDETTFWELFVRTHDTGPVPKIDAAVAASRDDRQFYGHPRLQLRLVPGWPLDRHPEWRTDSPTEDVAHVGGVDLDENALLAGALGRLAEGLGDSFEAYDSPGRTARLPGPPYQFMSRILDVGAAPGELEEGATLVAEYDVPDRCWYVDEAGHGRIPHCVLMEVGLQACGWLAVFGLLPEFDGERFFRNLDGEGTVLEAVTPETDTLRTDVTLTSLSRTGDMVLVGFDAVVSADGSPVYDIETGFGFFTEEALRRQDGLPADETPDARFERPDSTDIDLTERDGPRFAGPARLPGPMLQMLDRVTGWWPDDGDAGLGAARAESDVDATSWFFRAHFFQDPVQPGSLGLEAMTQLLQWMLLERGVDRDFERPRFEPIETDRTLEWRYRGQVLPENESITVDVEFTEIEHDERGCRAIAKGSLWVDGLRIYEVQGLGTRVVEDDPGVGRTSELTRLDPDASWLQDHRPTFTQPAVPMMVMVDRMVSATVAEAEAPAVEVRDFQLEDWVVLDRPRSLAVDVARQTDDPTWYDVTLYVRDAEPTPGSQRPSRAASARIRCDTSRPDVGDDFEPLEGPRPLTDPYESGRVFHGPAFQLVESGQMGERGACAVADAGAAGVPVGHVHPAMLDAALHIVPHDRLELWSDEADEDRVAFPHRLEKLELHGPTPTDGEVDIDVRFRGFEGDGQYPRFDVRLSTEEGVWASFHVVGRAFPEGPFGRTSPERRRRFLDDGEFVEGLGLSTFTGDQTRLSVADLKTYAWFDGFVADVYNLDLDETDPRERARRVAAKDHFAQTFRVHPSAIRLEFSDDGTIRALGYGAGPETRASIRTAGPLEYVVQPD